MEQTKEQTTNKSSKTKKIIIAVVIIIVIALVAGFFYKKSKISAEQVAKAAQAKQIEENNKTVKTIQKHMLVPNEQPIIATISQVETLLKEQAFYTGSKNGDMLVIFPKAQKAVIYSPSRDIIVNAGPFVVNSGASAK